MSRLKIFLEQAEFDYRQRDAIFHGFDRKEFSDHGRADLRIKPNDPRFGDNPLRDEWEELDEFAGQSKIERLHQMFTKADISDQQIRGGIKLTSDGTAKVAARLGVGPNDVEMYINSLVQQLRDADSDSVETLTELYYNAVNAIDEESDEDHKKRITYQNRRSRDSVQAGLEREHQKRVSKAEDAWIKTDPKKHDSVIDNTPKAKQDRKRPFDTAEGGLKQEDRYSIEPDALGNATVRDVKTGDAKFLRGGAANKALTRSKKAHNRDEVLAPLVETLADENFLGEIEAESGTYNFIWKLPGRHGLGTALFHADPPSIQLVDVRDANGDEIEMDQATRHELLGQARDFIGKE